MFYSALGGATAMNATQTQRKQANAERKAINLARNFTLDFVREVFDDEMGFGKTGACIDLTDLAYKALWALEDAQPELEDTILFLFNRVEKWSECEVQSIMHKRGYAFDYPTTLLSFSRVESAKPRKQAAAKRKRVTAEGKAIDLARNFVLNFVREVLDDQMESGETDERILEVGESDACVCITELANDAHTALEEAHAELKGTIKFLFNRVEKWSEGEVQSLMHERGYAYDHSSTLLGFSRLDNASA